MIDTGAYTALFQAVFVSLIILAVQWLVDTLAKGSRADAIPGKFPEGLSHDSFVFRAHRTFHNSLENYPLWLGTIVLVVFTNTSPQWGAALAWLFVAGRLGHMALYYLLATERNPSPRSGFFLLGWLANIALLAMVGQTLIS